MGDPIYSNVILLGAVIGAGVLPVGEESILPLLKERFPGKMLEINTRAFRRGIELIG